MNNQIISDLKELKPNSEGILKVLILINNINTSHDNQGINKNITKYFIYLKMQLIKSIFKNDAEINDNLALSFNQLKNELMNFLGGTINQNMKIIESDNFKVFFKPPNSMVLIKDKISIIVKSSFIFRPLSDEQIIGFCELSLEFIKRVNNIDLDLLQDRKVLKVEDFEDYKGDYFYVYLTDDNYQTYVKNGSFRLGSILKYHNPENKNSMDPYEGFSNLFYDEFSILSTAGFNYYIFCGTNISEKHNNYNYMKNNYGNTIIKINIHGFAKVIQKIIGAKSYSVKEVKYSTLKACRFYNTNENLLIGGELFLEEALHDLIKKESFLPSLFLKPLNYENEKEIRLVFEMNKDVERDISFNDPMLNKWIQLVHN